MKKLLVFAVVVGFGLNLERGAAQTVGIGDLGPVDYCALDPAHPLCDGLYIPPNGDLTPVPLPPAGLALLGGLAALYGLRRWRGVRR